MGPFVQVVLGQIISLFGNAALRFVLPLILLRQTGSARCTVRRLRWHCFQRWPGHWPEAFWLTAAARRGSWWCWTLLPPGLHWVLQPPPTTCR